MPSQFDDCYKAGARALEIYKLSTDCLMAHSIRAVERYLLEKYGFNTQIILAVENWMRADLGRVSVSSVAVENGGITYIYVQDDIGFNQQRFCIAHELYHVIWSIGSSEPSDHDHSKNTEGCCDCFANDLCLQHHRFYDDPKNIDKLKSIGDRTYRSS